MRIEPKPRIGEFGHVQLADVYHPGRSQFRYARHVGGLRESIAKQLCNAE